MKKLIAGLLISAFILASAGFAAGGNPLNYPIQRLYAAPTEDSNLIFEIPIDVKLLDISEDANWHKVEISFGIGPFIYTYVGWTYIPLKQLLREKELPNAALFLE